MKFLPLFIPEYWSLCCTDSYFASLGIGQARTNFFSCMLPSWPIRVKTVRHSEDGQNMQISTVDVTRCIKLSSRHGIWEEPAKEWEVFLYRIACFSELQNITCTEGTVLLIFKKDKVRRAHCYSLFGYNGPTTNASVLCSLHFEQSCYRRLLNSKDPLLCRCLRTSEVLVTIQMLLCDRISFEAISVIAWRERVSVFIRHEMDHRVLESKIARVSKFGNTFPFSSLSYWGRSYTDGL